MDEIVKMLDKNLEYISHEYFKEKNKYIRLKKQKIATAYEPWQ